MVLNLSMTTTIRQSIPEGYVSLVRPEKPGGKGYLTLDSQFLFVVSLFFIKIGCGHGVLQWSVAACEISLPGGKIRNGENSGAVYLIRW